MIILLAYIGSLCLPALDCGAKQHSHMVPEFAGVVWGWHLLLLGPLGMFILNPWFANPILWFGVWRIKTAPRVAGWMGILAMTFALAGLLALADELHMQRLLPGFWLWLASMAALVLTSFSRRRGERPKLVDETGKTEGGIQHNAEDESS